MSVDLQPDRVRAGRTIPTAALLAGASLAGAFLVVAAGAQEAWAAVDVEGRAPAPAVDTAERQPADPADVGSVDAIVAALYDVISGPAGEARDWDRFRSLFLPGAQLVPVGGESGRPQPTTVEGYVRGASGYFAENGFFEREVARSVHRYGPVVQIFSTYESRHSPDDAEPSARGVNSIQLVHDRERWWIAGIAWADTETAGPIPDRYR